jgi:hypothetical protein
MGEKSKMVDTEGPRDPELHDFRKILQIHGSKDWVTLLFLPTKIPPIHRVHIMFKDWPLN